MDARRVIEIDDVLVARSLQGSEPVSCAKSRLTISSSVAASMAKIDTRQILHGICRTDKLHRRCALVFQRLLPAKPP